MHDTLVFPAASFVPGLPSVDSCSTSRGCDSSSMQQADPRNVSIQSLKVDGVDKAASPERSSNAGRRGRGRSLAASAYESLRILVITVDRTKSPPKASPELHVRFLPPFVAAMVPLASLLCAGRLCTLALSTQPRNRAPGTIAPVLKLACALSAACALHIIVARACVSPQTAPRQFERDSCAMSALLVPAVCKASLACASLFRNT